MRDSLNILMPTRKVGTACSLQIPIFCLVVKRGSGSCVVTIFASAAACCPCLHTPQQLTTSVILYVPGLACGHPASAVYASFGGHAAEPDWLLHGRWYDTQSQGGVLLV